MRVARQASLCHDDALDAYQRALEIFVRRVDTVEQATEVAWLKVVIRHEAMAIRRARTESVAGEELDLDTFVPAPERSVEDQIASSERVRRSAEALRSLKPDEATALMMKAHGLSYAEIGQRNGWSYTKVNRSVTEGRRRFIKAFEGIEAGEECERFTPIVERLAAGSATAAQILAIRPHLRHCTACRATVRDLRLSGLQRLALVSPVAALAAFFHRAHASDLATGTGLASAGGGGRVATVATALGVCLSGATVGTVCVVTDAVPRLGTSPTTRATSSAPPRAKPSKHERSASNPEPKLAAVEARPARATPTPTPQAAPKPRPARERRERRPSREDAAPQEFGFENQAPAAPAPEPPPATAQTAAQAAPPPSPTRPTSKTFNPAEQEFAP